LPALDQGRAPATPRAHRRGACRISPCQTTHRRWRRTAVPRTPADGTGVTRWKKLTLTRRWRKRKGTMGGYVLSFHEIDRTRVAVVGGKGAHLGELSRIEGICVPAGFCVTTDAFRLVVTEARSIDERLDRLARLNPDDREAIRALSLEIRRTLEAIAIPEEVAAAGTRELARLGEHGAYAVPSSGAAGGRPPAPFAGPPGPHPHRGGAA